MFFLQSKSTVFNPSKKDVTYVFSLCHFVPSPLQHLPWAFLWRGGGLLKKCHLVKWKIVCCKKTVGGLGVEKLGRFEQGSSLSYGEEV